MALPRGAAVLITAIVSPNERTSEVVFPVRRDIFIISVSYLWLPRNSLKMRSARTVKPDPFPSTGITASRASEEPSSERAIDSRRQHERGGKKTQKKRRKGRQTRERGREEERKRSRRIEGDECRARRGFGKTFFFRPEQRRAR